MQIATREPLSADWVHTISKPGVSIQALGAIFSDHSENREGRVRLIAAPPLSWQLVLEVSRGQDLNWVHVEMFSLPDAVLVKACAEHDASRSNHGIWVISHSGKVLWHRPMPARWWHTEQFLINDTTLWIFDSLDSGTNPVNCFDFCVRALDLPTGKPAAPPRTFKLTRDAVAEPDETRRKKGRLDFSITSGKLLFSSLPTVVPADWEDRPDHRRLFVERAQFTKYRRKITVRLVIRCR